jgi:hypothetical protein
MIFLRCINPALMMKGSIDLKSVALKTANISLKYQFFWRAVRLWKIWGQNSWGWNQIRTLWKKNVSPRKCISITLCVPQLFQNRRPNVNTKTNRLPSPISNRQLSPPWSFHTQLTGKNHFPSLFTSWIFHHLHGNKTDSSMKHRSYVAFQSTFPHSFRGFIHYFEFRACCVR